MGRHDQPERRVGRSSRTEEEGAFEAYLNYAHDLERLRRGVDRWPLEDEAFANTWRRWVAEASRRGAWSVLVERLPQLRFPVEAGMSRNKGYRAATTQGVSPSRIAEASGLVLERPELVGVDLYRSVAGGIPLLRVPHRPDFVSLVQVLAHRNEPVTVPAGQGAVMVSGYVNWERVDDLRREWERRPPELRATSSWAQELARLRPRKDLYQDRFVILSDGPYSGVEAVEVGLTPSAWRARSYLLRREHEVTHYLARRIFGVVRRHVLEELAADYAGMVAALGRFRAATWLRFLGLEPDGTLREDGRLRIYRGDPPVSDDSLVELGRLLAEVSARLEEADGVWLGARRDRLSRARAALTLLTVPLERLAAPEGDAALKERWHEVGRSLADGP